MTLREKQMAARRKRILDTAERIIRDAGATDFSMRALAAAAETAPATPYNLFESKEGLLYALLARSLDDLMLHGLSFDSTDPVDRVLEAADNAVNFFLDDPRLLKPLYQVLLGVVHPVYRPRFIERSLTYWQTALDGIIRADLPPDLFDPASLARSLMAHCLGVLDFWIHDDVDDPTFRAQMAYGSALLLWPLATDAQRESLTKCLLSAKKTIDGATQRASDLTANAPINLSARRHGGRHA